MKLGDTIEFCCVLEEEVTFEEAAFSPRHRKWKRKYLPIYQKAMYIGYRFLVEGTTKYYQEDGPIFRRTGTVKALLVVINERQNPILLPFDDYNCPF